MSTPDSAWSHCELSKYVQSNDVDPQGRNLAIVGAIHFPWKCISRFC